MNLSTFQGSFSQHTGNFPTNTSQQSSSTMVIERLANRSQINTEEEPLGDKIAVKKKKFNSSAFSRMASCNLIRIYAVHVGSS